LAQEETCLSVLVALTTRRSTNFVFAVVLTNTNPQRQAVPPQSGMYRFMYESHGS